MPCAARNRRPQFVFLILSFKNGTVMCPNNRQTECAALFCLHLQITSLAPSPPLPPKLTVRGYAVSHEVCPLYFVIFYFFTTELNRLTARTSLLLYYVVADCWGSDNIMIRCPSLASHIFCCVNIFKSNLHKSFILIYYIPMYQCKALISST